MKFNTPLESIQPAPTGYGNHLHQCTSCKVVAVAGNRDVMQPVFFPHVLSCEWLTSERETQSHDYLVLERILDVRTVDDYYMKSSAVRWKPYGHEDHTGNTCEDPITTALEQVDV